MKRSTLVPMRTRTSLCLWAGLVLLASCGGGRGAAPGPVSAEDEVAPEERTEAPEHDRAPPPPPPNAQAIRSLPFERVDCRGGSRLDQLLRLGYAPARGWSCRVASTEFADLTGDGVEEAVVALDFQLTAVDQRPGGGTSERRLRSEEFVVLGLQDSEPRLLVQVVSDHSDITRVEPFEGGLRIELQGCWDCGCDIFQEIWAWDGQRFVTDEARSVQVYEAPPCDIP